MPRSLLPSTRSRSTRIPPTPPLFPYTTLFRSLAGERGDRDRLGRDLALHIERAPPPDDVVWGRGALDMKRDRKSTRLNSSHSQISYAVFCLKKKKTHHTSRSMS